MIDMYGLMTRLFPICRSITGNGVRETLRILQEHIPLKVHEVPSGTHVFDWTVPDEWNIKDAWIKNSKGEKIIDFQKSNIHVLNYSEPVHKKLSLAELKEHLHSLPDYPDWIPYLTTYYKRQWGFCLTHNQLQSLQEDTYEVMIDATLEPGSLTYGELFIQGETDEEVLFSTYMCHPSLCNDNLSGTVLLTGLAAELMKQKNRFSYRFLFIPETIGAITWLARNKEHVGKIKHGLVATCLGDSGHLTYKKTRHGNHVIDRATIQVLKDFGVKHEIVEFFPSGSDERQFCSPGFNLPIGSLMRTPYARFKEYHTSADNLDVVRPEFLNDTLEKYLAVVALLESNRTYRSLNPFCEPQLGKRGLYNHIGGQKKQGINKMAMFWVLNFSDGEHSLLDIAERSGIAFTDIKGAADVLVEHKLIE